jgi:SNF2 family DNA or RNA helicase
MTWHTEPFAHQREDVAHGTWNERFSFFHDCGLGKTKTMIDTFRAIRLLDPYAKLLGLCPGHLPRIWLREVERHAGGELDVFVMLDKNNKTLPPAKRKHHYRGTRPQEPDWKDRDDYAAEFPDIIYEPVSTVMQSDLWKEVRELEHQYLRAVQAGDAKARTSLRGRLKRRSDKLNIYLPSPAKKVAPAPRPAADYDVIALSYDLLIPDWDQIMKYIPYNVIVADESHYLRSNSKRTKLAWKLSSKARRRYLMSGTPALGSPMHLFGQLKFLAPFLTDTWWKYSRRYVVWKEMATHAMPVAFKNLHVLNMVVGEIAARRKTDECIDLPELRFITIDVHLDDETTRLYNETVRNYSAIFNDRDIRPANAADRLNKLLQMLSGFVIDSGKADDLCSGCPHVMRCVQQDIEPYTEDCRVVQAAPPRRTLRLDEHPRLDALQGLLEEILASEENKTIIWCTYIEELNMVTELLEKEDINFVRVDGRTKDSVAAQDRFNNDPSCRVYLAQVATGIGVTLNAANYVIYYGVTYSLDHYEQSLKRNYRVGQERRVTVYLLCTPGSIHEFVFQALERKQDISATLTDAIRCGTCERREECAVSGVQPFDADCVYDDTARRVVTRPALL